MDLYLYDPRTNLSTKTSYKELMGITGVALSTLSNAKTRGYKLRSINCYVTDGIAPLKQRRKWYAAETYKDEYWQTVDGSKNRYKISNYGRVKRIFGNGNEMLMMPFLRLQRGNLHIKIWFLGKYKDHNVGHIVAHHFIRPRKPKERLTRKNGILTDDFVGNLEYVTKQELGKRTGRQARSEPVVQLDLETKELLNEFRSIREAGEKCFISYEAIRLNCHGKTRHSGGYKFMFAEDYEKRKEIKVS